MSVSSPSSSHVSSVQLKMAQINQDKIFSPLAPVAVPREGKREGESQTVQAFQPPSTGNRASKLLPINSKRLRIHVLKLKYVEETLRILTRKDTLPSVKEPHCVKLNLHLCQPCAFCHIRSALTPPSMQQTHANEKRPLSSISRKIHGYQ